MESSWKVTILKMSLSTLFFNRKLTIVTLNSQYTYFLKWFRAPILIISVFNYYNLQIVNNTISNSSLSWFKFFLISTCYFTFILSFTFVYSYSYYFSLHPKSSRAIITTGSSNPTRAPTTSCIIDFNWFDTNLCLNFDGYSWRRRKEVKHDDDRMG